MGLVFKENSLKRVLEGRKTQTRRTGRYELQIGKIYPVKHKYFEKGKAKVLITRKFKQRLGDIMHALEVFKKLKQEFFLNYAKTGVSKDTEIASEILDGMIISNQIRTESDLEKILSFPFFKDKAQNKTCYRERLRLKTEKKEPLVDVKKIQEAEYVERLKEELKNEARALGLSEQLNLTICIVRTASSNKLQRSIACLVSFLPEQTILQRYSSTNLVPERPSQPLGL
jgi:hypothetical protein